MKKIKDILRKKKQAVRKIFQIQITSSKKKNIFWTGICVLFLGVICTIFSFTVFPQAERKKPLSITYTTPTSQQSITVTPSPTPASESSLPSGKIAYTQNGNVYLLEPTGRKQLTTHGNITYIKWSQDGKYLGWINRKTYPQENNNYKWNYYAGLSITLLNMQTNKQTIATFIPAPESVNGTQGIQGFDFSHDNTQIVYINQGLWLKNLSTGEEKKLADNTISPQGQTENEIYVDVSWNPRLNLLLTKQHGLETIDSAVYNLDTNQRNTVSNHFGSSWSQDGNEIITYQVGGQVQGGLWLVNTSSLATTQLIGYTTQHSWENEATVTSAADSKDNHLIATVGTFLDDEANNIKLPYSGYNIYTIAPDGTMTPLTKINQKNNLQQIALSWSPDGKDITYLLDINRSFEHGDASNGVYNLHIMHSDGGNDQTLLTNITSYAWYPLE